MKVLRCQKCSRMTLLCEPLPPNDEKRVMLKPSRVVTRGAVSLLACLGFCAGVARSEDGPWTSDFVAAKARAKAEKKLLLVDFTGSDWCGFCIKLHDEVFNKDPFKNEVSRQFVLVELDFPHEKKLPDDIKAQNEKLGKAYKVHGYPTVCLMDAEGQVVAKIVGYGPGSSGKYLERLQNMPKYWEEVLKMKAALAGVQGIARAKLLDQLVDTYENKLSNPIDELQAWGKEIISLDADNKAGLKLKYQFRTILADADKLAAERKFREAVAAIEKALALEGISSDRKQEILFKQGMYQFNLKDYATALKSMKQASEADANGELAQQIKGRIAMLTAIVKGQATITEEMKGLEKSAGIERAKVLDKLIQANVKLQTYGAAKLTPAEVDKWTAEIAELDADNAAGLKSKYEFTKLLREASTLARTKKFEEGLTAIDKALAISGIAPEQKQEGLLVKGTNYLLQKNYEKSLESFKQAEEAAPQGLRVSIIKYYINNVEQQQRKAAEQTKTAESKPEEKK